MSVCDEVRSIALHIVCVRCTCVANHASPLPFTRWSRSFFSTVVFLYCFFFVSLYVSSAYFNERNILLAWCNGLRTKRTCIIYVINIYIYTSNIKQCICIMTMKCMTEAVDFERSHHALSCVFVHNSYAWWISTLTEQSSVWYARIDKYAPAVSIDEMISYQNGWLWHGRTKHLWHAKTNKWQIIAFYLNA